MSQLSDAVARAARNARLHELAADLAPALAAALTERIPGVQIADAVSGLANPVAMFAALAHRVEVDVLFRAAQAVRDPKARASSLGALLAAAPERYEEVLAAAAPFTGDTRVFALVDGFPHLSAEVQATVLPTLAPGLARAGYAAQRIARGVRPGAFRIAWDVFTPSSKHHLTCLAILTAAAPEAERAALRASLVPRVREGGPLDYSAIPELLPYATGPDRAALVDRAFEFRSRYAAVNIKQALGDALAEPAIEARFVAFLDAGAQDYPWDLAIAHAGIAARRTSFRPHCLAVATELLDRMLDLGAEGVNPYPVIVAGGRIPTALEHQVNALLAVTLALDGEPRAHREQQVRSWLARVCPAYSRDDLVPIAWSRTIELAVPVLDLVMTIEEDGAAFDVLAALLETDRARVLDLAMQRIANRVDTFDLVASPAFTSVAPLVGTPLVERRTATPEELARALDQRVVVQRIVELGRLALEARVTELPPIEDPFVATVARVLLLDEPATGVVARFDTLLAQDRKQWSAYCHAVRELSPRLAAKDRLAAIETILGLRIDIYPLPDLRAIPIGLDLTSLVEHAVDSALPAAVIAAAIADTSDPVPLLRAVLRSAVAARLVAEITARAHGQVDQLRDELADFIDRHPWRTMAELTRAIATFATLLGDDERDAIAAALR